MHETEDQKQFETRFEKFNVFFMNEFFFFVYVFFGFFVKNICVEITKQFFEKKIDGWNANIIVWLIDFFKKNNLKHFCKHFYAIILMNFLLKKKFKHEILNFIKISIRTSLKNLVLVWIFFIKTIQEHYWEIVWIEFIFKKKSKTQLKKKKLFGLQEKIYFWNVVSKFNKYKY